MMKKILFSALAVLLFCGLQAQAQNATNSPYTQYGYGKLADQSNGASRGMAGMGLGWREGNQVNFQNPASYSCIDSISFIFDAGLSIQKTNFTEGSSKINANNSSFDYVMGAFRLYRHIGMAFGVMPYSNVGYTYYNSQTIGTSSITGDTKTTCTNTYAGSGGFRQLFLGMGVEPIHSKTTSISLGANVSYVWGSYTKSVINSYSDDYVNTLSKYYLCSVKAAKFDFGMQVQQKFSKTDKLTLGVTYDLSASLSGKPECWIVSNNSQTSVADTTIYTSTENLKTPVKMGVGLVWNHANRWRVGADWNLEKWGSLTYPVYSVVNEKAQYMPEAGLYQDRQRYTVGLEFCPKDNDRAWHNHIKYRAGFSYATPYLKINGADGPKEMTASIGLGIPIINAYNNRSVVNISAQWTQLNAKNLIKENNFMITVGLTFNERWFAKWQVE